MILDLIMPEMDGWEVCQKIRQLSSVPIIVLSALHRDAEVIRGLSYGADDYVIRPANPDVLLARMHAALRRTAEYIHVYISYLRRKLEPDPKRPHYFTSERGVGYHFQKQNTERPQAFHYPSLAHSLAYLEASDR